MTTITVSAKFQIVIPRVIREALGIRPGEKTPRHRVPRPNRAGAGKTG